MTTACQVVGACEQLQIATYVRTYVRASDLLGWGNRERLLLPFLTLLLGRAGDRPQVPLFKFLPRALMLGRDCMYRRAFSSPMARKS